MQKIPDAIIIEGPGRSGTTLLYRILSLHPDLGWISGYTNTFPRLPALSFLNRIQDWPLLESLNRGRRKWPRPAEAYTFWRYFFPDFWSRPLFPKIEHDHSAKRCARAIRSILYWSGKKRFVTKITAIPSIAVLAAVFEDPTIIWIDRDPRAVTMSYYKQRWGYKNDLQTFDRKRTRDLLLEYASKYMSIYHGRERLEAFRLKHVRYEHLTEDPIGFFQEVLAFASLEPCARFWRTLESWEILQGTNVAYKKQLEEEDVRYLNEVLAVPIRELGYDQS